MTKICFNWIWSWLISLVFRFSSSLPGQFSHHHSAGSTIWPESSSEIYQKTSQETALSHSLTDFCDIKPLIFIFFFQVCKEIKIKVMENLGEDWRRKENPNGGLQGDDFKDLRKDIRNELSELKSMMTGCSSCSNNLKAKDLPKVWRNDKQESSSA